MHPKQYTGVLSPNTGKKRDTHPDYTGLVNIEGLLYDLSGWIKKGRPGGTMAGREFISLSLRPKASR